jgi:hypothetical protein
MSGSWIIVTAIFHSRSALRRVRFLQTEFPSIRRVPNPADGYQSGIAAHAVDVEIQ